MPERRMLPSTEARATTPTQIFTASTMTSNRSHSHGAFRAFDTEILLWHVEDDVVPGRRIPGSTRRWSRRPSRENFEAIEGRPCVEGMLAAVDEAEGPTTRWSHGVHAR